MGKFAVRYTIILGALMVFFVNFIACGAQRYQVSMEHDYASDQVSDRSKDPSAPEFGIHATGGWKQLPIEYKTDHTLTEAQAVGLKNAMRTWELAVGKKLFKLTGEDSKTGDSFSDLYSSLDDAINGHYLDKHWDKTGKPELVLATTIWDNEGVDTIATADIRFNSEDYTITDSLDDENIQLSSIDTTKEIVDMESLALHELGHLLGLTHIPSDEDPYSIMNPKLYIGEGLASRRISRGDVLRIQRVYGCEGESCDIDKIFDALEKGETKDLALVGEDSDSSTETTTAETTTAGEDSESSSETSETTAENDPDDEADQDVEDTVEDEVEETAGDTEEEGDEELSH